MYIHLMQKSCVNNQVEIYLQGSKGQNRNAYHHSRSSLRSRIRRQNQVHIMRFSPRIRPHQDVCHAMRSCVRRLQGRTGRVKSQVQRCEQTIFARPYAQHPAAPLHPISDSITRAAAIINADQIISIGMVLHHPCSLTRSLLRSAS